MSRLNVWKFALAAAITFAALSLACAAAIAIAPDATLVLVGSWFHGLDLKLLVPPGGKPITVVQLVVGTISAGVVAFVIAALLAGCYNALNRGSTS